MTVIIGISGKIGSGKDYLAGKLVKHLKGLNHTTDHTSFATPLKAELNQVIAHIRENKGSTDEEIADIINRDMDMGYENAYDLVQLLREEVTGDVELTAYSRTLKIRTGLQDLGTKIRRAQNPNYWTEKFLETVEASTADYMFVSDARFPNEMNTVVDNHGVALRLNISPEILEERRHNRDGVVYTEEQINHISETALDDYDRFDIYVKETFNTADLVQQIETIQRTR